MPSTIPLSFAKFKQNLEISGLQTSVVSTRQQNVRSVVDCGLSVLDSFLTGSYSRNTLIAPLTEADIDIFVVLDTKYYYLYNDQTYGQAGLLDLVKSVLRKTYSRTPDISKNGQAITIVFEDFKVDVVPSFYRQGGGYLIPNSLNGSWVPTDPKKHVDIISNANKAHNGDFIPLIKMIKCWNRNNDNYFHSFHLEVLAYAVLFNVKISDFPSGIRYFFDKGRVLIATPNPDPAGYSGDVGSYINSQIKINEAVAKFQLAYERSLRAEELVRMGKVVEAIDIWRKIFGDYYPAYS